MSDYIVRAMAANAQIRAFAATTQELVEFARQAHNTSPVVTAGLGRLMTGAVMMGSMLKSEDDLLTLQIHCGGPVHGMTVTADMNGHVKGFADVPQVVIPAKPNGKLDVSGSIGLGILSVIKDMGLKEPYTSDVPLQTGEIAEDLTYYFASSEQVPSAVGLGVLMNRENTVRRAGGFIVQLMPFASDEVITQLEKNVAKVTSVTDLLEQGMTPEDLLRYVLEGFDIEFTDTIPCSFYCNCSRARVEKALISIGREELQNMIDDGEPIEMNCHFCNTNYQFSVDELKQLLKKARR